jgi:hypothetical protein
LRYIPTILEQDVAIIQNFLYAKKRKDHSGEWDGIRGRTF